jgi:DNA-directed RNA polymerase specialized sigma24 family protein
VADDFELPRADEQRRPHSPDETATLLDRVRAGDDDALEALTARILPRLQRWAHGRLPPAARGVLDTPDLVHAVVARAVRQLAATDARQSSACGYYLRTSIHDEIVSRWAGAHGTPAVSSIAPTTVTGTSPLERAIGAERLERYEAALRRLTGTDREAIVGRFEFAYSYDQLARYLGAPSADAARAAVHRAVGHLTEQARYV